MMNQRLQTIINFVLGMVCIFAAIMLLFAANKIQTQDKTIKEKDVTIAQLSGRMPQWRPEDAKQMRDYINDFEQQLINGVQNEEQ